MAYWQWSDNLSVGIEEIDRQHRKIIDYINLLDEAVFEKDTDKAKQVLDGLVTYTITHFAFEEDLMKKMEYEFFTGHKQVHESFTRRIADYQTRFNNGENVSRKLLSELRIWLTNHIKKDDQDYAPKLRGVKHESWWNRTLHALLN
ncbi:MAG: bacteriohemerythrin [Gammaproteobacteria bacterium]|nr:bacteriohemerythrin [Gammaproteobacteria bacterium]